MKWELMRSEILEQFPGVVSIRSMRYCPLPYLVTVSEYLTDPMMASFSLADRSSSLVPPIIGLPLPSSMVQSMMNTLLPERSIILSVMRYISWNTGSEQ